MTVHTTYFGGVSQYEPSESADVFGVVRYPKEFVERVTDRNIPAVAPPEDLLTAYKTVEEAAEDNGEPNPAAIAWNSVSYERRYLDYLEGRGQQAVLAELVERASEHDVWLVCWEKDARWCHRRLLANVVVAQLEDVEIVHHPDPTTIPVTEASDDESGPTLADFASGGA
ncbi:DUF488 family protein, N3 subclade [Natrarchaeobaculum sulfurireducens]|uniref:DUF488 domain-containing protein n=1 Tax=Natrarchaeobaculum sulfurireducens TaxID=2044521 RepID=A0A346PG35_9EURY|nr:DUF488 family protein [Natrarchaeobaculum sulfurireducens]AXR78480.1 hypothetical protein AArc1_2164 [Natrarchaeobaculum sulfurireducens]